MQILVILLVINLNQSSVNCQLRCGPQWSWDKPQCRCQRIFAHCYGQVVLNYLTFLSTEAGAFPVLYYSVQMS
jgi:hypothetical protein